MTTTNNDPGFSIDGPSSEKSDLSSSSSSFQRASNRNTFDTSNEKIPYSNSNDLDANQSSSSPIDSSTTDSFSPSPRPDEISLPHEILFVFCICLSQLFTQASVAQTIVPYKHIAASFGVDSPGEISWYSAGFSLTVGTFILIAGRLGDIYGLKRMFLIGFSWYSLWSLLCGISVYSKSSIFFSICRAFQGMGPAIMMPNAVGIFGSYYPMGKRRVLVMCCFGSIAPSGFIIGSVFSGLLSQFASWPWIFYIMSIACTIFTVFSYFIIPKHIGKNFSGKKQSFDTLGAVTGVVGLFLFNFAWNQGAVVGWSVPYVYALLIVGAIFLVLFIYVEMKVAENPLVPQSLYTGETGIILGCIASGWASFGIWIYYTHQFGIAIEGQPMLIMSARIVPCAFGGIAAGVLTAFLMPRVNISFVMLISTLGFFCGSVIMGTRPVNQIFWAQFFVSTLIIPLGMDMSFPAATVVLSHMLPKEQQGVAGSIVNTVVNYSISIGLGIAGTVETYQMKTGKSHLEVIRICFYTGMGLSGLGVLLAIILVFKSTVYPQLGAASSSIAVERKNTDEEM